MDLSGMTDKDLAAIASGTMGEVSDEGLQVIASQAQEAPEEAPPEKKSFKEHVNSMLYDLITNQTIHPNATEPATAAQYLAPAVMNPGSVGNAKNVVGGFKAALPNVQKGLGWAAGLAIARKLEHMIGGH